VVDPLQAAAAEPTIQRDEREFSPAELTDEQWRILDPLLPNRGQRKSRAADKRRMVNGILWVLHAGAPWRNMPERYGNWNSVFVRFNHWSKSGAWNAAFETLARLDRAHQHMASAKGELRSGGTRPR
jgi:transposase